MEEGDDLSMSLPEVERRSTLFDMSRAVRKFPSTMFSSKPDDYQILRAVCVSPPHFPEKCAGDSGETLSSAATDADATETVAAAVAAEKEELAEKRRESLPNEWSHEIQQKRLPPTKRLRFLYSY